MERGLEPKTKITLCSGSIETVFEINETIGKGGSCVAYKVTYTGVDGARHRGILKEYFPVWIVSDDFVREQSDITISEEFREAFDDGLKNFRETYDFITDFIVDNEQAANYHSGPMRYYTGNNTGYVLSYYFSGKSYNKVNDDSLLSTFEVILSTAKAVEYYHRNGYLHLDIKPKNILVPIETTQSIRLFDFDSLTKYESIRSGDLHVLPAPEDYRVPDFDSIKWCDVDYRTDIFEIGAMLFKRLFGKAPLNKDISVKSKINLDKNKYLRVSPPLVRQSVAQILKKTIVVNPDRRYSDISELIQAVERVIGLIDNEDAFFINMPKWQPSANVLSRKEEVREIDERLERDGCVFIKGIGGLGKSELAKLYAKCYAEKYHTVQFCHFSGNLKTTVAKMMTNGIEEKDFDDFDSLVSAKNALLHQSDKGMLIIIDNFNVIHDRFLRDFRPADSNSFRVIFTTRYLPEDRNLRPYVYNIPLLSLADCKTLFYRHYEGELKNESEEKDLEKLIEHLSYNTLMIILVAETLKNSYGLTVSDIYKKIIDLQMESINIPIFHEYDNSVEDLQEYCRMYNHLQAVFSVSTLNEIQTQTLKNATLIPPGGMEAERFVRYCESEDINKSTVNGLVSLGWLNEDDYSVITMHPVVSDLVALNKQIVPDQSYYNLERKLESFCNLRRCGFSTAMKKLECAQHLERRYINESDKKKLSIAMKIGRLHDSLFQSEKAKAYLEKALEMAVVQSSDEATALACQHLGDYYREFGTNSQAIKFLERSIEIGKKSGNRFCKIVVEATVQIANCHRDNNENLRAYITYLRALVYAKRYGIVQYITDIADELVEVCNELGHEDKAKIYSEFSQLYKEFDTDENAELFDEYEICFCGKETPEEKLRKYCEFLEVNCNVLGAASPAYKALQNRLWLYKLYGGYQKEAEQLLAERFSFIIATSGENSVEMAEEKASAAFNFADIGAFDKVEKFASDAIRICEQLGDTQSYAYYRACITMAKIRMIQGDTDGAIACADKTDASLFQGRTVLSETINTTGFVLLSTKRFKELEILCLKAADHKTVSPEVRFCADIILALSADMQEDAQKAGAHIGKATDTLSLMEPEQRNRCICRLKTMLEKSDNNITKTVREFFDSVC